MESSNGDLLQRKAFDTLLEANGALRAVAAAHQHDPTTQRLGLPAQGASRRGSPVRSHGKQNPNLKNSVIHGGRSTFCTQWWIHCQRDFAGDAELNGGMSLLFTESSA